MRVLVVLLAACVVGCFVQHAASMSVQSDMQSMTQTAWGEHTLRRYDDCTQDEIGRNEQYLLERQQIRTGNVYWTNRTAPSANCTYAQAVHRRIGWGAFDKAGADLKYLRHWFIAYFDTENDLITASEVCPNLCDVPDTYWYANGYMTAALSVVNEFPATVCSHPVAADGFYKEHEAFGPRVPCQEMWHAEQEVHREFNWTFNVLTNNCQHYVAQVSDKQQNATSAEVDLSLNPYPPRSQPVIPAQEPAPESPSLVEMIKSQIDLG